MVTGATGFIGRHLVNVLINYGHDVTAVVRDRKKSSEMTWFEHVNFIYDDINLISIDQLFGEKIPDAVVHLAWDGLTNYKSAIHIEKVLPSDINFLHQIMKAGVRKILITGTCLEYGLTNGKMHESLLPKPIIPYAIAKNALYQFLEPISKHYGCALQWARLFYMFGEGQNPNSLISKLNQAIESNSSDFKMSWGDQLRDYLPVTDVAAKLAIVLNSSFSGVVNICSGQPISVRRFVENYLSQKDLKLELRLGYYKYLDYEPMAFWGDTSRYDLEILGL